MSRTPKATKTKRGFATRIAGLTIMLTAAFGFLGAPGASASVDCNDFYGAGHGYWGCSAGLDHWWHVKTWESFLYYW